MRRSIIAALILLALAGCGTLQDTNATATPAAGAVQAQPSATSAAEPQATQPAAAPAGEPNGKQWDAPPAMAIDPAKTYTAVIETTHGSLTVELLPQDAPKTVNNFVFLAREDFYDNVKFHRVLPGFMAQTGDPTGTGSGGPGYQFEDEPVKREYKRGIVAMANAGPNTNGSQFFIMHADYGLSPNYTIFGQVTAGIETIDAIVNVPKTMGGDGAESAPTVDVRILDITITEQ